MAENIEIKVQDKVSSSISTKLRGIAADARAAHSAVENLQSALASLNTGALATIQQGASNATKALQQTAMASQKLATEQARTATATAQAAAAQARANVASIQGQTAQQNLATATARAATAQNNSATAAQRLATEQQRTAAASDRAAVAALRLQQAQAKAAAAGGQMEREAEALKRSLYPLYEAQQLHNESVQRALTLYKSGAISVKTYTDAVNRSAERMEAANIGSNALGNGLVKTAKGSQLAAHHLTNLGFQIQDIGVSLASGQNPLTVLIQQGAQIGGIAAQAEVSIGRLALEAGKMLLRFAPLAVAVGGAYAAFSLFNKEVEDTANLKAYADTLGLTAKEMKKLEDVSVTFGDTMSGLWDTINERTGAGEFFSNIADGAEKAFRNIIGYGTLAIQSLIALFRAGYAVIVELWARFPAQFKKPIADALNFGISQYEKFVNFYIDGINKIIEGLNLINAVKIDPIEKMVFGRIDDNFAESNGKSLADTFVSAYTSELDSLKKSTSNFMKDWQDNTAQAARDRLKKQADAIKADRTPKTSSSSEESELEKLQRRLAKVRGEVSPSDEALRKLAQAQDILNRSVAAGLIDQAENERVMGRLRDKYRDQLDPIGALNRELKQEYDLLNMLPEAREAEQRMMQIENQFREKNIDLTAEQTAEIRKQIEAIQERTRVAQAEQQLLAASEGRKDFTAGLQAMQNLRNNPNSGFTEGDAASASNSMLQSMGIDTSYFQENLDAQLAQQQTYYDQLAQMREANAISEESYRAAKLQLDLAAQNVQLNAAAGFFGQLSQLQKSENSKMAAVGKAAAIAQAMINTYQSATGAYSSLASIPYVGPALGAAAAAAAIAAGLANVQQIRSQNTGFQSGGYTGNGGVSEVAGVVHGKEYVMDAGTTSRIGVDNLQALQSGAASVQRNGENVGSAQAAPAAAPDVTVNAPVTALVVQSKESALAALQSSEGKSFIIETIEENGGTVARIVGVK